MISSDVIDLQFSSDPGRLAGIREQVRLWAERHGWSETDRADIVLAVDEALTNVIRHGYDSVPDRPIFLRVAPLSHPVCGEGLEVCIRDFGKQVPLDRICGRDLEDLRPGGLGVHIIRSVMHSVVYSHAEGGGMQVLMHKFRVPPNQPSQAGSEQS